MRLVLSEDRKHYALEAYSGAVNLTMRELDELLEILDKMRDQLTRTASRAAKGVVATKISSAVVNIDMHHTEIVLTLNDQDIERIFFPQMWRLLFAMESIINLKPSKRTSQAARNND